MKVTKEITIAMGHSVTGHKSKCRGLHGHDYRIIATVDGQVSAVTGASDEGMVIDFGDLKQAMMNVIDRYYDHGFILYDKDPRAQLLQQATDLWCFEKERFHLVGFIPTAENLAKHWANLLEIELYKRGIKLYQLEVYETPTSSAIYTMPGGL
jgi:6-pyruvoyltetrahydropterin/6-carboxytetrahydropterin synthase